jgi:hypothetical protein
MRIVLPLTVLLLIIEMLAFATTVAGQTTEQKVRAQAEAILKPKMHDPSSYEFVSLKIWSRYTYRDAFENLLSSYKLDYFDSSDLRIALILKEEPKKIYECILSLTKQQILAQKLDSIGKARADQLDKVSTVNYLFSSRGKNAFNAKVLTERIVQVNARTLKVFNIATDRGEIVHPIEFPGDRDFEAIKNSSSFQKAVREKVIPLMDSLGYKVTLKN